MSKVSGVRPVPEPRREFFESDEAYRYFLDLTRALKSLQVGTADDLASHQHTVSDVTDLTLGKTIGDVPQYEDDGSGNPVVDHPNMPEVGGVPIVDALSDRPVFSAWLTGGVGTSGIIKPYGHVEVNQGNHFDATAGRFTAPVDGLYKFEFVAFTQTGSGNDEVRILKNGATFTDQIRSIDRLSDTGYTASLVLNAILSLVAGDYIEIEVYTGEIHDNNNGYFTGYQLN